MPSKKSSPRSPRARSSASSADAPAKVQQTIYLRPETRKKLRLRAVEEDTDLSTVVERALLAYFGDDS